MSKNLSLMMTKTATNRGKWLEQASQYLKSNGIVTPQLDSELILAHVLNVERINLHTHPEATLTIDEQKIANRLLQKRAVSYPVAYITGQKEFFGYDFIVSPDVLIPRPETEELVEQAINISKTIDARPIKIADVGCGSGVIGLSLSLELNQLEIPYRTTLSDIDPKALEICRQNQIKLGAMNTKVIRNNLLENITEKYDIITANLPYVSTAWEIGAEVEFEPKSALFADDNGLTLISQLIDQIKDQRNLHPNGWLILESDPRQQKLITEKLQRNDFKNIKRTNYITAAQAH
ncbi:MAG: peptide chain release factor N(5)-glutamine methyltransferase [Candidatus Nanosyncoccaceae bacterium]